MENEALRYKERTMICQDDNPEYLRDLLYYYKDARDTYNQEKDYIKMSFVEYLGKEVYANRVFEENGDEVRKFFPNESVLTHALCEVKKLYEYGVIDSETDKVLLTPIDLSGNGVPAEKIKPRDKQKGLILPTGEYYPAFADHYLVSDWLMLNGKDTKCAVRSWVNDGKVYFSDMQGYCLFDKDAVLTQPQAEALFNTCKIVMGEKNDLHETMMTSYSLGFLRNQREREIKKTEQDFSAYSQNLTMLENASNLLAKKESEKFSSSYFEREVKRNESALRFMRYC